tara:strand:+ start:191 stop:364 length:174 start_codon:yes stop_codon:yes gene_type:complete
LNQTASYDISKEEREQLQLWKQMDIKENLMNKIENKENENCVMKQMLDSIRENIKVA